MKNKNSKVFLVVLLVAIIAVAWFFVQKKERLAQNQNTDNTNPIATSTQKINENEYLGVISQNANGQSVYINHKYGLVFAYPKEWNIGDNHLGYGTFQLFNFVLKPTDLHYSAGQNKIESSVCNGNIIDENDEGYGTKKIKQVIIAGENSVRADYEDNSGLKSVNYNIPIPNFTGKYFCIYIAGEPSNFYVLDDIVKSIEWVK